MADELQGKKIAYLISPQGTERVEFTDPKKALEDAGADVDVISIQSGEARTMDGDVEPSESFPIDKTFSEVSSSDYDGLVVPGGTVGAATRMRCRSSGASSSRPSRLVRSATPLDAHRGRRRRGSDADFVSDASDRP